MSADLKRIEDKARQVAEPFLSENGCILWDVLFEKEGALHYLKILFDSKDGVMDIDKCEKLTPPLNKLMDAEEFIKQVDILEIGSPGVTRRLRHKEHFELCKGKEVRVMKRADNGKTEIVEGVLNDYDAQSKTITIFTPNGEESMNLKKCIRITLNNSEKENRDD